MEIFLLLSQLAQLHCRNPPNRFGFTKWLCFFELTCHGLVMRSLRQWWTMPLNFRETFAGPKKKALRFGSPNPTPRIPSGIVCCAANQCRGLLPVVWSTHYLEDASLFGFCDWPSRSCNPMLTKPHCPEKWHSSQIGQNGFVFLGGTIYAPSLLVAGC